MDVNGTRFHLVLGEGDWLPPQANGGAQAIDLEWDTDAVRLRKLLPSFPARHGSTPLSIDLRRGAARDRFGNWYWIGEDGHEIRVSRMRRRPSTRFWSAEDAACGCIDEPPGIFTQCIASTADPLQLAGLAVTTDHYLIAGRLKPAGLLIFDLRGGGAPLALDWPTGTPFTPFDISAAADGGAWILDRDARTLWRLDRYFRVVWSGVSAPAVTPVGFKPVGADGTVCPPAALLSDQSPLHLIDVEAPIAVEALPDGSVLVLDDPALGACSVIHRYRLDGTHFAIRLDASLNPPATADDADVAPALPLRAHDIAFVPTGPARPLTGTLFVAGAWGNQAYTFTFKSEEDAFSLALCRQYLPTRRFTGKAIVASAGHVYYDIDERWITLVEYPSPRFVRHGTITLPAGKTQAFDGKEVRCVWHRLLIDGCVPYEAAVTVDTRSADRIELLADLPWTKQPRLYRRGDGSEIPGYRVPVSDDGHAGTWELLLQEVVGRYLQVRLTIEGTGRTSARLSAIRIHYPRFSYVKEYLPAVYREDGASASFLERYLANVEGTLTTLEGKIEHVESLFDPHTAPTDALDWLAGWLGATLDFKWSDRTRRLFLMHAPQMFRERGTCAGLVRSIRLALDRCPTDEVFDSSPCGAGATSAGFGVRIVERFRTRRAPGVVFGDPTELLGPGSTTNLIDWTPARGPLVLHQRFRDFLSREYSDRDSLNAAWNSAFTGFDDPALQLAAVRPSSGRRGADWQKFVESEIGFTYAVVRDTDEPLYREFLARRYGQPSAVNGAYHLDGSNVLTTFADVRAQLWDAHLRQSLPSGTVWLQDWIQFVSIVLPMERAAHSFTVLVPVGLDDGPDEQIARRNLAERITQIEKPAHAAFDVKLYWGMFRVGEARVALETLVGVGSRSVALVLDRGVSVLGAAHLAYAEPWNATDHLVVGREGNDGASSATTCGCGGGSGCGCGGNVSHGTARRTTSGTGGCGCH